MFFTNLIYVYSRMQRLCMYVCFQILEILRAPIFSLQGILSVLTISLDGGREQPDGNRQSPLNTSLCLGFLIRGGGFWSQTFPFVVLPVRNVWLPESQTVLRSNVFQRSFLWKELVGFRSYLIGEKNYYCIWMFSYSTLIFLL